MLEDGRIVGAFGAITKADINVMHSCLEYLSKLVHRPIKILEIGVNSGDTSRGIKKWLDAYKVEFKYYCIDNNRDFVVPCPFDGAIHITGDSVTVYNQLPNDFDFIFIDGCHCYEHVKTDCILYREKVASEGIIAFHDTADGSQGLEYQGHGDTQQKTSYVDVQHGLRDSGILDDQRFVLMFEVKEMRGVMVFKKN